MTPYETVRAAVVKASLSLSLDKDGFVLRNYHTHVQSDVIGLADVLIAASEKNVAIATITETSCGSVCKVELVQLLSTWDWKNDDLSKQSPETLAFLQSLLT